MQLPQKIGKYEIIEVIGWGAMGVVYKARDSQVGELIALKVLTGYASYAGHSEIGERLQREVQVLKMLRHANIVAALEVGEHEGSPYVAYEFLEGETLDSVIRSSSSALTVLQKLDIISQVSEALQYVHAKGFVHRNVKPRNIMLLRDGRAKLMGLDAAYQPGQMTTRTGEIAGTPLFMAPEVIRGQAIDLRADVFSLGATFYQVIDGKLPFQAESLSDVLAQILDEAPRRSREAHDLRLPELQAIFDKALARQKNLRYQSCLEFSQDVIRLRRRLELGNQE